ncbi:MAG: cupin domain-containing protein [Acetobacteraceae bacterium]
MAVTESNATSYPEPYRAQNQKRWNRRLGEHAKLGKFGVNLTRIAPGGQSSHRHAHARQDEFIYVLEGEVALETDWGTELLGAGMCAGFPAGSGNAHRFVNRSDADAILLVVGDRTPGDEIIYPDIDMRARMEPAGGYRYFHKNGTAF